MLIFTSIHKATSFQLKIAVFVLFGCFYHNSYGQINPYEHIEKIIEKLLENSDNEFDYSEIQDKLISIYEQPFDLNSVEFDHLQELIFLNHQQIQSILDYRKKYRGFASIYELKSIAELNQETIEFLKPFMMVGNVPYKNMKYNLSDRKYSRNEVILKTKTVAEKQLGYRDKSDPDTAKSYYLGNSFSYYVRFNQSIRSKYSLGLTLEKDAGEEFFRGTQKKGFDYYSAHFFIKNIGPFTSIAIGDYSVNLGQGLAFYSGFGFGKSPLVTDIYKSSRRLSPYKSVNESNFLRGIAVQCRFGKIEMTAFYSNKLIDGTILNPDSFSYNNPMITSFYKSGYHRTKDEMEKRKSNREQIAGAHLIFHFNNLKLGLTTITGLFSNEFQPQIRPYQLYDFSGSKFNNLAFNYSFAYKSFYFFGEHAFDGNAFAHLSGTLIRLGEIQTGILYRNYSPAYTALYSNSFRESADISNEKGLYFSLSFSPISNCKLDFYVDRFHFPWLDYQKDAPTHGHEYLLDMHYTPNHRIMHNIRVKSQSGEKNLSGNESPMNILHVENKLSIRYDLRNDLRGPFSLRSRIEYAGQSNGPAKASKGFLTFQDISYSFVNWKLKLTFRYAVFHTDNYFSRIYAYENDIPLAFSINSFYGRGMRYYLVFNYQINSKSSLWIKIARTKYADRELIGSGLNEINGDHKTDVKLLLRIVF
ncbi:MAG: helix-hairpin-helix domain-containing protein [Bacteroidetes bacterium]|nr:helix-hairpin-helix domain-containing protein [Bacteroidota bacterium]